jgi:hypothetical protein
MTYLTFSNVGNIVLGQLDESCNFNIYEFRILSNSGNVVVSALNSTIVDLDNVTKTSGQTSAKYYILAYL